METKQFDKNIKKGLSNTVNDYIYFWSGVDKDKRAKSGVIIAISRRLENSISNWNPISERILTVDLRIKGRDLRVFGIYAPTDDSDFNIKEDEALKHWSRKCRTMGVWLNDSQIHTILFADDQIVMAEDCQDMTYMLNKLIEEYKNWGLEVNKEKTQYMVIGGAGADMELDSGTIKGRNKRGRPRKKWIKNVNKEMEKRELQEGDWNDKDRWRLGCEKRQ
ncbi:hypothetical protein RN001_009991 [Aquatica leii]|uniref:Reverse transcriptase domain-containing protein n=1 Tax=Aquatica leii TaxID=1421715 RepID=A0AAN7SQ49_9COLE|nr:hypothetical protein RN001_009991 [Aquatica leii]